MPVTTETQGLYWMLQLAADTAGVPGTYTTVGFGTSNTLDETFETSRTVNKTRGLAGAKVLVGSEWSTSFEGDFVPGDAGQLVVKAVIAAQKTANPTAYWARFVLLDDLADTGALVDGSPTFTGQAWITNRNITAGTTENAKLSLQFEGTGDLVEDIYTAP